MVAMNVCFDLCFNLDHFSLIVAMNSLWSLSILVHE